MDVWGKYPPDLPADDRREWPGVSPNYVSSVAKYPKPYPQPKRPGLRSKTKQELYERDCRIIKARKIGETYVSIAKREGMSRQHAFVICEKDRRWRLAGYHYWGA